jgi:hypothetical protein
MSVFSDRIGPMTLPNLPRARCKGSPSFVSRPRTVQAVTCRACPESPRCPFSAAGRRPRPKRSRELPMVDVPLRKTQPATGREQTCTVCGLTYRGHGNSRYCSRACAVKALCGTMPGLVRHSQNGEQICDRCLAAQREYRASKRQEREARHANDQDTRAA